MKHIINESLSSNNANYSATQSGNGKGKCTSTEVPHFTDMGNAARFVAMHKGSILYNSDKERWIFFNGVTWDERVLDDVLLLGEELVRQMYIEASSLPEDERKAMIKFVLKSESARSMKAMIEMARPHMKISDGQCDKDPNIAACINGVIDLRTGELRDVMDDEILTNRFGVEFNPYAACPLWERFIDEIMGGEQDMIDYLQRVCGYALTGSTSEHAVFFLYGSGSNGKSTFIETLEAILGGYYAKIPIETFTMSGRDRSEQEQARLPGKRFVVANEVEENGRLRESKLKDAVSGDTMVARHLFCESFEFKPQYKLFVYGNHKPVIRGTDDGIWRRIHAIPFEQQFDEESCDSELGDKLKGELPGILNWLIRGCLLWRSEKLSPPNKVVDFTKQYRSDMDVIYQFILDCCAIHPANEALSKDLYEEYREWCAGEGVKPRSHQVFTRELAGRGYINRRERREIDGKTTRVAVWHGISLIGSGISTTDREDNSPKIRVDGMDGMDGYFQNSTRGKKNSSNFCKQPSQSSIPSTLPPSEEVMCKKCSHFIPTPYSAHGICKSGGSYHGQERDPHRPRICTDFSATKESNS